MNNDQQDKPIKTLRDVAPIITFVTRLIDAANGVMTSPLEDVNARLATLLKVIEDERPK